MGKKSVAPDRLNGPNAINLDATDGTSTRTVTKIPVMMLRYRNCGWFRIHLRLTIYFRHALTVGGRDWTA